MKLMDLVDKKWMDNDYIKYSLQQKRKKGIGCGMWNNVGIPKMVNLGKWNDLLKWEKEEFLRGVKDGKWDKNGNHLKDNNPYKQKTIKLNEMLNKE